MDKTRHPVWRDGRHSLVDSAGYYSLVQMLAFTHPSPVLCCLVGGKDDQNSWTGGLDIDVRRYPRRLEGDGIWLGFLAYWAPRTATPLLQSSGSTERPRSARSSHTLC